MQSSNVILIVALILVAIVSQMNVLINTCWNPGIENWDKIVAIEM